MSDGLAVMLRQLFGIGRDTGAAVRAAVGKTIAKIYLKDDVLTLTFADGTGIRLKDHGQSCCEKRYMRTDDDLAYFVGAEFVGGEIREAPPVVDSDSCGEHEVQFLAIQTSRGEFVMSSHNEHNGYYGGFAIEASAVAP